MTFILDTNVVSELRKARRGKIDPRVAAWAGTVSLGELYLSVITVFELEIGVQLVERKDHAQGWALRRWLDASILRPYRDRILDVDRIVAKCAAELHIPNRRADRDAFIAATALTRDMIVVTRNVGDFEPTGVRLINPWNEVA